MNRRKEIEKKIILIAMAIVGFSLIAILTAPFAKAQSHPRNSAVRSHKALQAYYNYEASNDRWEKDLVKNAREVNKAKKERAKIVKRRKKLIARAKKIQYGEN